MTESSKMARQETRKCQGRSTGAGLHRNNSGAMAKAVGSVALVVALIGRSECSWCCIGGLTLRQPKPINL